jgi:hypothetical protein
MHRRKIPNRNIWTRYPRRMLKEAGQTIRVNIIVTVKNGRGARPQSIVREGRMRLHLVKAPLEATR